MATPDPTSERLVSTLPNGRFRIEIDRMVRSSDAPTRRVRIRRVLPAQTSRGEALALAAKLEHELLVKSAAIAPADGWDAYVAQLAATPKSWLYATVQNARHRAKQKEIECTLTADQLRFVLLRSKGRCEVTGLRFSTQKTVDVRARLYFHSIDRIESSKGYTVDNVRAVCHATNIAMNQWGEEVFAELARGFVFNRYSAFYGANR